MKTASVEVGTLIDRPYIRIVGVQLASPFHSGELKFLESSGLATWDAMADAAQRRVNRLKRVLEAVAPADNIDKKVDLVAFPEYSIPKIAHTQIDFQEIADTRGVIIIPGSYFEDSEQSKLFKNNVCHVYIPKKKQITIVKLCPTPGEEKFVTPNGSAPNSAALLWTSSNGAAASVNLFLCRDYLMSDRSGDQRDTDQSSVDYQHEGLNLVLMHSDETRLFEGIGGVELRGLRGKRRLAMFVNCASTSADLGTALLGPSSMRERDDIVCSVPWDREGIVTAELRLLDVKETTVRPGRTVDGPIRTASAHELIDNGGDLPIQLAAPKRRTSTYRAIWRPAFLSAINMAVSVELYIAKKITKVSAAFEADQIENVYAGIVRGVHDLLVRRYVNIDQMIDGVPVDFIEVCSKRTADALRDAVRTDETKVHFVVYPRNIWKYRGRITDFSTFDIQQESARSALKFGSTHDARRKRRRILTEIRKLAESCERNLEVPQELRPLLFDDVEEVIPVGSDSSTDVRETYLFVRVSNYDGAVEQSFETDFLKGNLIYRPSIREMMKITNLSDPPFQYILKMKSKSREADEVVQSIRSWAEQRDLNVATRTVDITHYLAQRSLPGIETTSLGMSALKFVSLLREKYGAAEVGLLARLDRRGEHGHWLLLRLSSAWEDAMDSMQTEASKSLSNHVFDFYVNLLLYFADDSTDRDQYFLQLRSSWRACYDRFEEACLDVVDALYLAGALGDASVLQKAEAVRAYAFERVSKDDWLKLRNDDVEHYFRVTSKMFSDSPLYAEIKESEEAVRQTVKPMRNIFFHAANKQKLVSAIDLTGSDWDEKSRRIEASISKIINLVDQLEISRNAASSAD